MDDVVHQAMAKWPNVPHCFGWLMLDARGNWRMRDERAQQLGLPGDKIRHPTLLGFINRNYTCDDSGHWYFQNGPQRVYVDLEIAPYIVRTDPGAGWLLHTDAVLPPPVAAWMTQEGRLILLADKICAALDDRDIAALLATMTVDNTPANDEQILAWLEGKSGVTLQLRCGGDQPLTLQRTTDANLAAQFGFILQPRAIATA